MVTPFVNVTKAEAAKRRQRVLDLIKRLPEVTAEPSEQNLSLEVRGRRFAWYLESHHDDRRLALHCKAERGTNRERVEADPVRLHIPKYLGHHGWLGVWIDLPDVDWTRVEQLLVDAYRMTAPRMLVAKLPDGPATAPEAIERSKKETATSAGKPAAAKANAKAASRPRRAARKRSAKAAPTSANPRLGSATAKDGANTRTKTKSQTAALGTGSNGSAKTSRLTAASFIERLEALRSPEELRKIQRYFKTGKGEYAEGDQFIGVRMGHVFQLAKEFIAMPLDQIDRLLQHPIHEVRAGALSIMDKQARRKSTTEDQRRELFELYLKRLDHINNWDLVDLAAPFVIGRYLYDKPRDVLHRLANPKNDVWRRRTAIVSTAYFIRQGDIDETFTLAEKLLRDPHELIHKATGGWLREAGKRDHERLLKFLDTHAPTMPRTMLRYAIEHLGPEQRAQYLAMGKPAAPAPATARRRASSR